MTNDTGTPDVDRTKTQTNNTQKVMDHINGPDWRLRAESAEAKVRELEETLSALNVELKEKNYACAVALESLWKKYCQDLGEWEYPAQAARMIEENVQRQLTAEKKSSREALDMGARNEQDLIRQLADKTRELESVIATEKHLDSLTPEYVRQANEACEKMEHELTTTRAQLEQARECLREAIEFSAHNSGSAMLREASLAKWRAAAQG